MLMPSVSRYMTLVPITIPRTATVSTARQLMRDHHIHHLPVVENGELVGVVDERELGEVDGDREIAPIEQAMSRRTLVVTSDTALDEVVEIMCDHAYGSAVIVGRRGIEGIFTKSDACRVLASVLRLATS